MGALTAQHWILFAAFLVVAAVVVGLVVRAVLGAAAKGRTTPPSDAGQAPPR